MIKKTESVLFFEFILELNAAFLFPEMSLLMNYIFFSKCFVDFSRERERVKKECYRYKRPEISTSSVVQRTQCAVYRIERKITQFGDI